MKSIISFVSVILTVIFLQGCSAGHVMDSTGQGLSDVDIVAVAECIGDGCKVNKVSVMIGNQTHTGYRMTSNSNGYYFFDSYGVMVNPGDAMYIHSGDDDDKSIVFSYKKVGFDSVTITHTPDYKTQEDNNGNRYLIDELPKVYMCGINEPDTNNNGVCDGAENLYNSGN